MNKYKLKIALFLSLIGFMLVFFGKNSLAETMWIRSRSGGYDYKIITEDYSDYRIFEYDPDHDGKLNCIFYYNNDTMVFKMREQLTTGNIVSCCFGYVYDKASKKSFCKNSFLEMKARSVLEEAGYEFREGEGASSKIALSWLLNFQDSLTIEGNIPEAIIAFTIDMEGSIGGLEGVDEYYTPYLNWKKAQFEEARAKRLRQLQEQEQKQQERDIKARQIQQWMMFRGLDPYTPIEKNKKVEAAFKDWLKSGDYNPNAEIPRIQPGEVAQAKKILRIQQRRYYRISRRLNPYKTSVPISDATLDHWIASEDYTFGEIIPNPTAKQKQEANAKENTKDNAKECQVA